MDAIIYTSNTGFTEEYAKMFGKKTGIPVYSLADANGRVKSGADIIYFGWLMASGIKGYKKAMRKYHILAVCGVGLGVTGSRIPDVRQANGIAADFPLFTLQGGFDIAKLHGIYKFMMSIAVKDMSKSLSEKTDKTPEEADMLELMQNGGSRVCEENLKAVFQWIEGVV